LVSLDSNADLELDQLHSDGTTVPVFGPATPPAQETIATVTDPASGASQTQLVVPIQVKDG
jgi:hypothetical protein